MIQSFKKRLMFEIAISLMVIAVIAVVLVYLGRGISEKSDAIYKIKSDRNANAKIARDFADLTMSSKGTEVMMDKLNNALPTKDDIFEITRDISILAKQYNLGFNPPKFVGLEVNPTDAEQGYIKLEMTAQGGYTGVVRFIKDLETDRFFVKITNIDIVRQGFIYNAIISGELYFK